MGQDEAQAHIEGTCECTQCAEGGVAFTSLDTTDLALLDTRLIREPLLRPSTTLAQFKQLHSELEMRRVRLKFRDGIRTCGPGLRPNLLHEAVQISWHSGLKVNRHALMFMGITHNVKARLAVYLRFHFTKRRRASSISFCCRLGLGSSPLSYPPSSNTTLSP